MKHHLNPLLPLTLALLLGACTTVESRKPEIDTRFENASFKPLVSANAVQAPENWWTGFSSEQLNTLMQQAQADNLSLEATEARLRAAQASLDAAQASFFPSPYTECGQAGKHGQGHQYSGASDQ